MTEPPKGKLLHFQSRGMRSYGKWLMATKAHNAALARQRAAQTAPPVEAVDELLRDPRTEAVMKKIAERIAERGEDEAD